MELLGERLVACGWTWKDDMKAMWRASVPNSVKAELLRRIRSFLVSSSIWVAQRLDFFFPIFLFVCYNIAVSLLFW